MVAKNQITIIEVPSDVGSICPGKSRALAAFESTGLVSQLHNAGYTVTVRNALPSNNPV
jgi:hypothetical protein